MPLKPVGTKWKRFKYDNALEEHLQEHPHTIKAKVTCNEVNVMPQQPTIVALFSQG